MSKVPPEQIERFREAMRERVIKPLRDGWAERAKREGEARDRPLLARIGAESWRGVLSRRARKP